MSDDQQEYTTAVIVAVPATDDPVHQFVTEDAHITLQFMGEAADLPVGAAEQMMTDLETLTAALYPFPAKVSGTALLGKDQANVLLIESDPLTKIREILGSTEPVAAACASVEQFPNWIPHLTLAYPDEDEGISVMDGNMPVDTVTIGGLSLWLGGDKHDFPFVKAAPGPVEEDIVVASAITAALGGGKFDPSLHPRGADGQFIEKFGIVKFLTGGSWSYGKVTGISKDAHDQVKIEVTPSDLSGQTSGTPKEMLSKQLYKAPKAKAHLSTTAPGTKKIGGQGGSNPGGLYEIPVQGEAGGEKKLQPGDVVTRGGGSAQYVVNFVNPNGQVSLVKEGQKPTGAGSTKWWDPSELHLVTPAVVTQKFYVKKPKSKSHGQNEALANDLYAEAGVPVPEVDLHADGQLYSKIVDGKQDMAAQLKNPEWASQVQKNFAVDAWLGNRDVFGMTYDNVLTDANGTPWRIDNGGALLYRAQGAKKTDFGSAVSELNAFRTGKKSAIYGPTMSKADELDGAQRVLAISPARIEEMVSEAGLPKSLADTLKARRAYIADYYGLPLPESQKPDEAQEGSSAPLVDAADLAANKGKQRTWFKVNLAQASFLLQAGDTVEFPNGDQQKYGVDGTYSSPLSIVGAQAQLMGWQQQYGADAQVMFRKSEGLLAPRPEHASTLTGVDLSSQNWRRGDKITLVGGDTYKVLGANPSTGAVLVQAEGKDPWLLDTFGANKAQLWEVQRWDPPAKPEPVEEAPAPAVQAPTKPVPADDGLTSYTLSSDTGKYEATTPDTPADPAPSGYPFPKVTVVQAPEKTGQAAQAEAAIKDDLITPLPTGNGPAAPKPDTAPAAAGKGMLIGDGTEAQPGAELVSNKDGKTYTFLKKKGQYAVVTDPNGEDPTKQLLKLASTMTQPGAAPTADPTAIEKPKTATGEVPALGMMAVSKDGHAGEITLISPDGKFVFITDANGTRKRKSTGTVSITSTPVASVDTPKALPGPVKPYSAAPTKPWTGEEKVSGWEPTGKPAPYEMVHVGYADGSTGLEPYTGQPLESMQKNASGAVAVYGGVHGYMGPISASQLAQAAQAAPEKTTYQVIFTGSVFYTDGTTGPSGGLVLWYPSGYDSDVPGDDAFELSGSQILNIIGSDDSSPLTMPEGTAFQTADESPISSSPAPLYGDEAKTLADWKGDLSVGQEISLDGQNWMAITAIGASGSVTVITGNGDSVYLNLWSSATYVVKAPPMADGDDETSFIPQAEVEQMFGTPAPDPSTKPANELVKGDVIVLNGQTIVLEAASTGSSYTSVKPYGKDATAVHKDFEPEYLGNISQGPVEVNVHTAFPLVGPGSTIDVGDTSQLTALSYPQQTADGNYHFAAIETGKPETPFMVNSTDFGPNVTAPVHLAPFKFASDLGVDAEQVDALFEQATTVDTTPIDHNWAMAQQGIDFGTAQYPIFFNATDTSYYRNGPTGVEGWEDGAWKTDSEQSTAGMDKVWDGNTFEGELKIPASLPQQEFLSGEFGYKPAPGELVVAAEVSPGETSLFVYPSGNKDGTPHWVISGGMALTPVSNGEVTDQLAAGTGVVTIHDPFSEATDGPSLTHHEGPQPPSVLGAKLQQLGYTPKPGDQFFYGQDKDGPSNPAFLRGEDGRYRRIGNAGVISSSSYTLEELIDPNFFGDGTFDFFTYTYIPEGTEGPKPVQGMPDGFAPFVPGEGQSVLKVTLNSGNSFVYLQQQPGASWYLMAKDGTVNESATAAKSDWAVQNILNNGSTGTSKYELLSGSGITEDNPSFNGYTPDPGDEVISLTQDGETTYYVHPAGDTDTSSTNYEYWLPVTNDGYLDGSAGMAKDEVPANLGPQHGNDFAKVWPAEDTPAVAAPAADTPSFNGYTPTEGDTVLKWTPPSGNALFLVKKSDDASETYKTVQGDGTIGKNGGITQSQLDNQTPTPGDKFEIVWPVDTADTGTSPVLFGYQTKPGDSVVQMVGQTGFTKVYVKPAGASKWQVLDGETGQFTGSEFDQDTIEFGASVDGVTTNVLLGELKGTPATPEPLTEDKYAGVKDATTLYVNQVNFPGYNPKPDVLEKIGDLGQLMPGQSLYVIDNSAKGAGYADTVWVRDSYQQWYQVTASGTLAPDVMLTSDAAWDQYTQAAGLQVQKMQFGAPTSAPVQKIPYSGPSISGWQDTNLPDPTSFSFIGDPSQGKGAKAGSWIFINSNTSGVGLFVQLKTDWDGTTQFNAAKVYTVQDGKINGTQPIIFESEGGSPWNWVDTNSHYISGDPVASTPTSTAPSAPAAAPSAPVEAPAPSPVAPSYPGAVLPSQEDINAWGGSLTKDGFIPASGMYVTGKGPMSGKIVSVSKDKTKAVVLTGDGKKTTRLIEALKTDKTANYQAYVAPAAPKDIPGGMPLAVDTPAEALAKTVKDGKFRAILSGHPGVSQGQMVVTKATGPSGKAYNRVHLTLTPAQRTLLLAKLSGTGEKGDWATSSKSSEKVAVGDQLPMRKSSTDNPDGTPRWKVDPAQVPPTHTVTKVEDDPVAGVKLVTMTNNATGEAITSRFHPGKSLVTYTWDPNKPKAPKAGSFNLSGEATANGWQLVNDGGISAATGGATDAQLYNEPGKAVTKSAMGQVSHSWQTLRNVSANGVVIETIDPKGSNKHSSTGVTVLSIPEGLDETALGGALAELGIDYTPMNQDGAKTAVRGLLRTLLDLDMTDVDTPKHYSDEQLFAKAGQTIGLTDLGWNDVLIAVDESSGKLSYFWSDRARSALAAKAKYNLIYRAASTGTAAQIVSTVKYGSASSVLKKTTGMLDGSGSVGNGASASSDNANHAGHGSYASASSVSKLPTSNASASYKSVGMMIYHRPEAVLGRIMDYRVAGSDAFGEGKGQGADHLSHAVSMSSVKDYFLGGGLPSEAIGFIAVNSGGERAKALEQLKSEGITQINGRPIEEIVILLSQASSMKASDLPPVLPPANARPITDLPMSYDAPTAEVAA